jgi:1-aminocyclopropane-1-carboxylate deaminase
MNEPFLPFFSDLLLPSPLERIDLHGSFKKPGGSKFYIKRDDLIHPVISGNKWRKLAGFLPDVLKSDEPLISIGGPYSNHLDAFSFLANHLNRASFALVTGFYPENNQILTPTLDRIKQRGTKLIPVTKEFSRALRLMDGGQHPIFQGGATKFTEILVKIPEKSYWIPEGGATEQGIQGCKEIILEIKKEIAEPIRVWVSMGTGTTASGIYDALDSKDQLNVVSALKGVELDGFVTLKKVLDKSRDSNSLLARGLEPEIIFHSTDEMGPFGKTHHPAIHLADTFFLHHGIQLDYVYNARTFSKMLELADWEDPRPIVFIHTGGLQGLPVQ